ncbi:MULTISPECIES: hypothetical protein [unclassified Oleiphilus]|uniref:hypothetical protein n=1 Tax=unclassified Oleiphilus TaxID=2631174 RepID=UPI0007C2A9F1|nr:MULTISPECIES: hypothetical protein [unclassified Oleiphilus]KZZ34317.1 hypothetical protein A3757_17970 [Oleiphilus sp. HI0117]KZZ52108.1 hypothetical protein A3761_19475 [Oleiphilus sp. HI0123]
MKSKITLMLGILFFAFSYHANSAETTKLANAEITNLMIDSINGDVLFISAEGELTGTTCTTNQTWEYVLPVASDARTQTMISFLLTAYAAGKKVTLRGTGVCGDTYSSIETLYRVKLD